MSISSFFRKSAPSELNFSTRSEAFAYMLRYQLEHGATPMDAADAAGTFADVFATNMGLPVSTEPPAEGVDLYLQHLDKVVSYCDRHPKIVDVVIGVATFVAGAFAGGAAQQASTCAPAPPPPSEPIDFEKID